MTGMTVDDKVCHEKAFRDDVDLFREEKTFIMMIETQLC